MVQIWVLFVFFIIFTLVLLWERHDYKNLYEYTETLEHYLDIYISKYGTLPGISEIPSEDIDVNKSE